jgi:hypothetical protein
LEIAQNDFIMKRYSLSGFIVAAMTCSSLLAQEKAEFAWPANSSSGNSHGVECWRYKISPLRISADQAPSGLPSTGAPMDTHPMNITRNIGMLLLAIYLIAVGILTLTGLGIGIITGVLALLAGIFILIGR